MSKQVEICLEDIDLQMISTYSILGESEPDLSFLDHECEGCSNQEAFFYCNVHSKYVCQKCRNKEHHQCMNDGYVENIREFRQEVQFDLSYLHTEIRRFWILCQGLGISMFNDRIYTLAESYENWLDKLERIADNKEGTFFDKLTSRTTLQKMKSVHVEIQKAIDWSGFDKTQLLYCLKLLIEKLGADFEDQIKQKQKDMKEEGKVNPLMESFKQGKLPKGAVSVDSMPKLCQEVQEMVNRVKETSSAMLPSSLVFRSAVKLESGEYYEGQWTKSGVRQGLGRCLYPDGSLYEGFWNNGIKEGLGRYITSKDYFEGIFDSDVLQPIGFYRYLKENCEEVEATEQAEIDLEQQIYFTPDSQIWQKFGHDCFVMRSVPPTTEIFIPSSKEKSSLKVTEEDEIYFVTRNNEGKEVGQERIYPKKKMFCLF